MTASVAVQDDEHLITQVADGSAAAFSELYDRYDQRAFRVAWSVCRRTDWAEDAVQDAFISIWRSSDKYRPERGAVAAWLLTVVRYRALDVARRGGREHSRNSGTALTLDQAPAPDDVASDVIAAETAGAVQVALTRLPREQSEVITLAFFGQLTHAEIASRLRIPDGTVKGRIRLAMNKLRGELAHVHA